jgi:hypothetical protein
MVILKLVKLNYRSKGVKNMKKLLASLATTSMLSVSIVPTLGMSNNNALTINNNKLSKNTIESKLAGDINLNTDFDFEMFKKYYFDIKSFKWENDISNLDNFVSFYKSALHEYFAGEFNLELNVGTVEEGVGDILFRLTFATDKDLILNNNYQEVDYLISISGNSDTISGIFHTEDKLNIPAKIYNFREAFNKLQTTVSTTKWTIEEYNNDSYINILDTLLNGLELEPEWPNHANIFSELLCDENSELIEAGISMSLNKQPIVKDESYEIVITVHIDNTKPLYNTTFLASGDSNLAQVQILCGSQYKVIGDEVNISPDWEERETFKGTAFGNSYDYESGWLNIENFLDYRDYMGGLAQIKSAYNNFEIKFGWYHSTGDPVKVNYTGDLQDIKNVDTAYSIYKDSWKDSLHSVYIELQEQYTHDGRLQIKVLIHGYVAAWKTVDNGYTIYNVKLSSN